MSPSRRKREPAKWAEFDLPELLAHALAIEREAAERYHQLAQVMEAHNNLAVAEVFAKLARIESRHAEQILAKAGARTLPVLPPLAYRWPGPDSPEAVDASDLHYLMTPHHALALALKAEERAFRFFNAVAATHADAGIKEIAEELAEEERGHMRLMMEWLVKTPVPPEGWAEDLDLPLPQE